MKIYSIILSMSFFTAMAMEKFDTKFLIPLKEEENYSFNAVSRFDFASDINDSKEYTDELLYYLGGYDHPGQTGDASNPSDCGHKELCSTIASPDSAVKENNEEDNDTETEQFYANCPICFRFFKYIKKDTGAILLKAHLRNHGIPLKVATPFIRDFIGCWRVKFHCPYFGVETNKGKKCTYSHSKVVQCNRQQKPFRDLEIHLQKSHNQRSVNSLQLVHEGHVQMGNPIELIEEDDRIRAQDLFLPHPPQNYWNENQLSVEAFEERCTCMTQQALAQDGAVLVTYSCPYRGHKMKNGERRCAMDRKQKPLVGSWQEIRDKLSEIILDRLRHIRVYHKKDVTIPPSRKDRGPYRELIRRNWVMVEEITHKGELPEILKEQSAQQ